MNPAEISWDFRRMQNKPVKAQSAASDHDRRRHARSAVIWSAKLHCEGRVLDCVILKNRAKMEEMGAKAREFVRENFLLTRHLREYLALIVALISGNGDRIVLN